MLRKNYCDKDGEVRHTDKKTDRQRQCERQHERESERWNEGWRRKEIESTTLSCLYGDWLSPPREVTRYDADHVTNNTDRGQFLRDVVGAMNDNGDRGSNISRQNAS